MPSPKYERYVIAYDIVADRRRTKVSNLLSAHGVRVNNSVFEVTITHTKFILLKDNLQAMIKPKEDSIRIYPLCQNCAVHIETLGEEISPFKLINTFI